jgi:hypothetical protein
MTSQKLSVANGMVRPTKAPWFITGKQGPLPFSLSPYSNAANPDFTFVYTNGKMKLRKDLSKSPEATFTASCLWPINDLPSSEFIKQQLTEIAGGGHSQDEIGKTLLKEKNRFFVEYLEGFKGQSEKEIMESAGSSSYDAASDVLVVYSSANVLCLSEVSYEYTGGAHGNYGTTFYVLDLKQKRRMALSDIFINNDSAKLSRMLERN